jgi:hypothetical protein
VFPPKRHDLNSSVHDLSAEAGVSDGLGMFQFTEEVKGGISLGFEFFHERAGVIRQQRGRKQLEYRPITEQSTVIAARLFPGTITCRGNESQDYI